MSDSSAENLGREAVRRVAECRKGVETEVLDLSALQESVRVYCEAVAELPKDEGKRHAPRLEALMEEMGALKEDLTQAQESVRRELSGLGRLRQANVAYQKSDAIGPVYHPKKDEN